MEENIKYIDIKALKLYNEHGGCVDDYLFMTDKLDDIMQGDKTVKLKVFMMLYCIEGEIKLELNNITCRLKADDLLVSLSNMVMSEVMISSNCRVKIICFLAVSYKDLHKPRSIHGSPSIICIGIRSSILMRTKRICFPDIWN